MINDTTWNEFRHAIYGTLESSPDALFELIDALLSQPSARSLVELSLAPVFRRRWPSIYEALGDGRIDLTRLREVLVRFLPRSFGDEHLSLGIDASSIVRAQAHTSPDRGLVHVKNPDLDAPPVDYGWQFSTVMVLPNPPSSWTYLLDQVRIPTSSSAVKIAIEQLRALRPLLPMRITVVADAGYGVHPLVVLLQELDWEGLLRLKTKRVFYRQPYSRSMDRRGHPDRFQCNDESSHGPPSRHLELHTTTGKPMLLDGWEGLYIKGNDQQTVSLIRITRPWASGRRGDPKESWFVWVGQRLAPLEEVYQRYVSRFSQEQCYRFLKQDLLWSRPHLRDPDIFERWSQLVMLAFDQLVLAKEECEPVLLPWERKQTPITPRRIRRSMPILLCEVETPAHAPQLRGLPPGRAVGFHPKKAPRYPVIPKYRTKSPPGTRRKRKNKNTGDSVA